MYLNLNDLVQQAPSINLTVSAADLRDFASQLIEETKEQLENTISDAKAETYVSSEKAMEILDICKTTLWRWKKRNYLIPIRIGGNDRYRMSDIKKIMEG